MALVLFPAFYYRAFFFFFFKWAQARNGDILRDVTRNEMEDGLFFPPAFSEKNRNARGRMVIPVTLGNPRTTCSLFSHHFPQVSMPAQSI